MASQDPTPLVVLRIVLVCIIWRQWHCAFQEHLTYFDFMEDQHDSFTSSLSSEDFEGDSDISNNCEHISIILVSVCTQNILNENQHSWDSCAGCKLMPGLRQQISMLNLSCDGWITPGI